jgi:hypothetical protein
MFFESSETMISLQNVVARLRLFMKSIYTENL